MNFEQPQFGNVLRETRFERNLSQPIVAELIGVSVVSIWRWETNAGVPKSLKIRKKIDLWIRDELIVQSNDTQLKSIPTEVLANELIRRGLKVTF